MLREDRTALICDLAETYHVLDWKALPLRTVAALAAGLRDDARIVQKLTGTRMSLRDAMAAITVDKLSLLWWAHTKDAEKNRNRPQSIMEILTKDPTDIPVGFATGEELMEARRRIMEGS